MAVPTVETFLGCFELTTGALIAGYFSAVVYGILILASLFLMIFGLHYVKENPDDDSTVLVVVLFILIALFGLFLWISVRFIQGVKQRNAPKMKWFLIIHIISTVLTLLSAVLSFSASEIAWGLFDAYFCLVIYSLYKKIEDEGQQKDVYHNMEGGMAAPQAPY